MLLNNPSFFKSLTFCTSCNGDFELSKIQNSTASSYIYAFIYVDYTEKRETSRVTRVTLVLWIGNETLRSLRIGNAHCVTESETHIESRQFIGWWRDAISDAMTLSGHTGERAIHSSDFSAEKNPVGSVRSLAANAVSHSLFREQGLRE